MKKALLTTVMLILTIGAWAQFLTTPPSGGNQQASVTQWIGLAQVTITYNSPDVTGPRGESRKGKIWGEVVHYGYIDQGFGTSKAAPWRAGANENTTITFSHDVVIADKTVKAGTYGLFLAVEKEGPWTWILSSDSDKWGSYFYDPKNDVVRVQATPEECEYTEWLTYSFDQRGATSARATLQWENKRVGFTVNVPNTNELYLAKMREELYGTTKGFTYHSWVTAVQFCVQNNINLEEALAWADNAISGTFVGQENFQTLSAKAAVLTALNRPNDADAIMMKAINHPTATVSEVHQYGRTLLATGKNEKAMEVFKLNQKKHPEEKFTTYVGLARGYAALGDKKNAIRNWEIALKNLPENQKPNKALYEEEVKKLKG